MKYKYVGINRQGGRVDGIIDAQDTNEARLKLRSMQLRPQSLVPTKGGGAGFSLQKLTEINLSKPIDLKGMVVFSRQFSSLIDSGVPIVQCLDILAQQERRPLFKKILETIKVDIEGGAGLAEALAKHPKAFNEFFIRIVEAGEISGTLDQAIKRVGLQLEKLGRLRSKVIGALIYPILTVIVSIIVLIFLLIKVIPEISKLYSQSSASLPEITQFVLNISSFVQNEYGVMIGVVAVLVTVTPVIYRQPNVKRIVDPLLLKVPLFGSLIKKSGIARFSRTLSTLTSSGVPLLTAFDICTKLISNTAIKETIRNASIAVAEGKSIASGLTSKSEIFPPMVTHMVSIGEMTGRLDDLLGKVADIYDDEVDDAVGAMTGLLQPALIIVVGAIIAFLLMAMYLPIFQLAEKVTGGA